MLKKDSDLLLLISTVNLKSNNLKLHYQNYAVKQSHILI